MRKLTPMFVAAVLLLLAAPAHAQSTTLSTTLNSLNGSGDTGTSMVTDNGDGTVTVTVNTSDVSPGLPHAQHIHIGGENICPPASADQNDDGFISSAEGAPFYGGVQVSLTTEGDVSADSALAVERFPVASAAGTITYERTFDLPEGVTFDDVRNGVVVQHGISELFEDPAQYDGEPRSSLNEELPLEATIPGSCGPLLAAAAGGADTGFGGAASSGFPYGWIILAFAIGGLALNLRRRGGEAA